MVHPVLEFRYLFFCDPGEIGALGIPAPDHAVMVFVGALLPGGVAVAVVDLKPAAAADGAAQLLIPEKFRAVVRGDALELLFEIRQRFLQPVENSLDGGSCFVRQFEDHDIPADSLHLCLCSCRAC